MKFEKVWKNIRKFLTKISKSLKIFFEFKKMFKSERKLNLKKFYSLKKLKNFEIWKKVKIFKI